MLVDILIGKLKNIRRSMASDYEPFFLIVNRDRNLVWEGPYLNEKEAQAEYSKQMHRHPTAKGWAIETEFRRAPKRSKAEQSFHDL